MLDETAVCFINEYLRLTVRSAAYETLIGNRGERVNTIGKIFVYK